MATSCCGQLPVWVRHAVKGSGRYCNREGHLLPQQTCFCVHIGHISQDTRTESIPDEKCAELLATCVKCRGSLPAVGLDIISQGLFTISAACIKLPRFLVQCLAGASLKIRNTEHGSGWSTSHTPEFHGRILDACAKNGTVEQSGRRAAGRPCATRRVSCPDAPPTARVGPGTGHGIGSKIATLHAKAWTYLWKNVRLYILKIVDRLAQPKDGAVVQGWNSSHDVLGSNPTATPFFSFFSLNKLFHGYI